MESVRRALCSHIETVRSFVLKLVQVDSGVFSPSELNTALIQPEVTLRLETEWLKELLHVLQLIKRYITVVNRWEDHVLGLAKNMGANQAEIDQFWRQEAQAEAFVLKKTYDSQYLRWVLEDTAQEVDRIIAATQQLIDEGAQLIQLTERFGGPFLTQFGRIAKVWVNTTRREFYTPLLEILQAPQDDPEGLEIQRRLSKYLDRIALIVSSTPMFADESSTVTYSPRMLQQTLEKVDQLIQGTENLQEFVQLRSQAFPLIIREQEALLQAVLPQDVVVSEWLITLYSDQSKKVDELLPTTLNSDTLPLAIKQAGEELAIWHSRIMAALPYLQEALILNDLLQSPTVAQFLNADQQRLELFREWETRITHTYETIRNAVSSSDISK